MTTNELRELLSTHHLESWADSLAPLAKMGLRCVPGFFNGSPSLGFSKIGGDPDLPKEFAWPHWHGSPLDFLAQFRLEDLSRHQCCQVFPTTGHVWFFYATEEGPWGFDPKDRGGWQVVFFDIGSNSLAPRQHPGVKSSVFSPRSLTFQEVLTFPDGDSFLIQEIGLRGQDMDNYLEFHEEIRALEPEGPRHQLLGHPQQIQGDMLLECQLASHGLYCGDATGYQDPRRRDLEKNAKDRQLLFHLDTDDDAGMMWGDCGSLYFWIKRQDLAARNFDAAWMVLQCC